MLRKMTLGAIGGVSRRGFLKSLAAAGCLTAAYGCSKSDSDGEMIFTGGGNHF